jgi:hypothetical protein
VLKELRLHAPPPAYHRSPAGRASPDRRMDAARSGGLDSAPHDLAQARCREHKHGRQRHGSRNLPAGERRHVVLLELRRMRATTRARRRTRSRDMGVARAQPGLEATSFPILVTEQVCASGQSSEGRLADPLVEYRDDAVLITTRVEPPGRRLLHVSGKPSDRGYGRTGRTPG